MGYDDNNPLTGVTGGGLPAEIWHEVMVRINEGVDPKPLLTEIPDSTYVPVDPSTTEGAVLPEDVPYFDDPNAPSYDGEFYEQPLPEALTAPMPGEVIVLDGPPPPGAVLVGPVENDLATQIDQLLGIGN
jgi:penicillin-binding protein 1A